MKQMIISVLLFINVEIFLVSGLDVDHWGTNFVFTFPGYSSPENFGTMNNIIIITAVEETDVIVTLNQMDSITAFKINENETQTLEYGNEVEVTSYGIKIENLAISVVASKKVSVYAYSYYQYYTEGMLILPVASLGIDYMVVNLYTGNSRSSTLTIIIAVDDETEVNIQFKLAPHEDCSVDNTLYHNGDNFTFILNDHDVLGIKCESDNTGSRITSNKPIGVVTGSRWLQLPIGSWYDPTMEMLPPVTEYGTEFSLIAPEGHGSAKSMLRVVPLNSGTSFVIKGEQYTPLKGEAVDIKYLNQSEKICFQATDKVIVVIFMLGDENKNPYYYGDAYMSLVPPVDRATNDYMVFNNVLHQYDGKYKGGINIVVPTSVSSEIIPSLKYEQLCPGYNVYRETILDRETKHYHSPSPFLLLIYGFSQSEAFGFPAGMKLSDFSGVDECASSPCQNGGWCIDTTTSFRCHCKDSRYNGTLCEIDDVNDCLSHQCQHGICVDVGSSYKCKCYSGYTGDMCETDDVNDCLSHQCQHGICVDVGTSYKCKCYSGYTGDMCDTVISGGSLFTRVDVLESVIILDSIRVVNMKYCVLHCLNLPECTNIVYKPSTPNCILVKRDPTGVAADFYCDVSNECFSKNK